MKVLSNNYIGRSIMMMLPVVVSMLLTVACKDTEPVKWVDLRYRVQDEYTLEATNPEPILIQVKSTDTWQVYGLDPEWCTITPSTGQAGETYDVTVTYKDNTELDDRIDTLTIRSDYWIGKTVPVIQKGIAYLRAENTAGEIAQTGGSGSITIEANQDWSVLTDDNSGWLNITSDLKGSGNGVINFSAGENKGERRMATFSICNRKGVKEREVTVIQTGVQLDPAETLLKTDFTSKTLTVDVVSNSVWTVALQDENQDWISFDKTEYDGSDKLSIIVNNNAGTAIRNATILLRTIAMPGVTQVEKRIILRQANDPVPDHYEFNASERTKWSVNQGSAHFADGDVTFSPGRLLRYNFESGNYRVRIKSWDAAAVSTLYFCVGDFEIRWHLNASRRSTDISVRNNKSTAKHTNVSFDPSQPHEIGLNMSSTPDGYTRYEWLLDGVVFNTYSADGSDGGDKLIPFGSKYSIFLGCSAGTVVYDWWEYAIPYELFDWGD